MGLGCYWLHGIIVATVIMKLTAPKTADQYLKDTDHAVGHAYAGLATCWRYVQEARLYEKRPVEKDGMLHYLPPTTPRPRPSGRTMLAYVRST
jgi:hypothetical protein